MITVLLADDQLIAPVRTHRTRSLQKLHLPTTAELIRRAIARGLDSWG